MTPSTPIPDPSTTARGAVEALETFPPADLLDGQIVAAAAAVEAAVAVARDRVFPSAVVPTSADTLAAFDFHTRRFQRPTYGPALALLHGASIDTHPLLAEFIRAVGASEIRGTAIGVGQRESPGESLTAADNRVGRVAVDGFMRAVCGQVVQADRHELAGAAADYLAAVELAGRVDAVRDRQRAELAVAAAAKIAADRQAKADLEQAKLQIEAAERIRVAQLERAHEMHQERARALKKRLDDLRRAGRGKTMVVVDDRRLSLDELANRDLAGWTSSGLQVIESAIGAAS